MLTNSITVLTLFFVQVKKLVLFDPHKFKYLDSMLDPRVEVDNQEQKRRQEAVISLTWLKRSCEFILFFLSKFIDPVRFHMSITHHYYLFYDFNWVSAFVRTKTYIIVEFIRLCKIFGSF